MKIVFSSRFIKSTKVLDKKSKIKLQSYLDILIENPFNIALHTKPLHGSLLNYYSFRLGRNYRVIFKYNSPKEIYLIKVGHRKDIYK